VQAASAELIAAIAAQVRVPAQPRVRVDWARDGFGSTSGGKPLDTLDADVTRVTVVKEVATDLPPGVKRFAGTAAATAQATLATPPSSLASPDTTHTAWKYSPVNPSGPLNGLRRLAAPATVALGMVGANGPEYLDQLTGSTRTLAVDGPGRQAVLDLLDRAEDFRRPISLPMILADDRTFGSPAQKPGLHSAWVVDWIFRQCGYYVSPAPRSSCVMSATMHGSGWPEVGSVQEFRGLNYSRLAFPPLTPGFSTAPAFLAGVQLAGNGAEQIDLNMTGSADPDNGNTLFMEAWVRFDDISHTNGSPVLQAYRTGVSEPWCVLWVDTSGRVQVSFNRAGGDNNARSTGASGPSGIVAGTWYYLACYVEWANANTKVWIRKDATTTGPITIAAGSTTTSSPMNTVAVGRGHGAGFANTELDGIVEACQVTTEDGFGSPPGWNNAFTPTAVITGSHNELIATPVVEGEEAWAVLGQLAAAELAMVGISESGQPYFRDRTWFSTPPQDTSQETITTLRSVKAISVVEDVDSVRNHWVVKAAPPQVGSPTEDVWSLTDYVSVPASGSRTIWATFDQPVAYLDTSLTSHGAAGNSRYNASTVKNGGGSVVSNLTFTVTPFAQSAKIVITNPNAFVVWLVGNNGVASVTQGIPSLKLVGQPVIFGQSQNTPGGVDTSPTTTGINTRLRSEASDATSISNYGERVYEFPDNPWLQDVDSLDGLAAAGLAMTKDPVALIEGQEVVGNIRRQLTDRVTIQDPDGLKLDRDFHLTRIETTQDADGGLVQRLDVRGA
jgi:hypothetical protein